MLGTDFPVGDYYTEHIIDGETIARGGGWWTAVLLLQDPKDGGNIVALYRWQSVGGEWKARKQIKFRKPEQVATLADILVRFRERL